MKSPLFLMAFAVLSACGNPIDKGPCAPPSDATYSRALRKLNRQEKVWAESKPSSYDLSAHAGGWRGGIWSISHVDGNEVSGFTFSLPMSPDPVGLDAKPEFPTVDTLFSQVRGILHGKTLTFSIAYDAHYGFPATVSTDLKCAMDAGGGFSGRIIPSESIGVRSRLFCSESNLTSLIGTWKVSEWEQGFVPDRDLFSGMAAGATMAVFPNSVTLYSDERPRTFRFVTLPSPKTAYCPFAMAATSAGLPSGAYLAIFSKNELLLWNDEPVVRFTRP